MSAEEKQPESIQHLCEPISIEEISWALNDVKKDTAPGLDR